jgi:sigma-E factor negative regulatory protein RseB
MRAGPAVSALLFAGACTAVQGAQTPSPAESLRLLSQMSNAARQLNYVGTFVYRHGSQTETSRIWHMNDETGSYERLQTLDGPPREIVRVNDEVTCYYPDAKRAKIEKGNTNRRFPAVVSEQLASIFSSYSVRKAGMDRVAGYDCQVTVLEPRDALRYGHAFCAELKTGLPLRAKTFNERNETVETFAFTQIEIGANVTREHVKPSFDVSASGWALDKSALALPAEAESRWVVVNRPAGFRKVLELKRTIHGKAAAQLVFSDGLAAVSIFIEPAVAGARASQELAHHGAINVFSRPQAGHVITALGEAPASTVIQFGNAVTPRAKPPN